MLGILSLLVVFGYSFYFFRHMQTRGRTTKSHHPYAKCIPMVLAMTSSLTIGLVIAIWLPQQLAVGTLLAIGVSAASVLLMSWGFGFSGRIEAQSSSLMGAMMGVMLGVMLSTSEITLMVVGVDLIYLISIFAMTLLLTKAEIHHQNPTKSILRSKSSIFYLFFLLSISSIVTMGFVVPDNSSEPKKPSLKPVSQNEQMNHYHGSMNIDSDSKLCGVN